MDPKEIELLKKYRSMVFQAIESLLPAGISKESVEEACSHLDVTSLSDVAEERSLANICGYPLCSVRLQPKKWQKYLIRGNRVYDTEERRRFCSDKCYESFVFIAKQLPEEPLWFRGPRPEGTIFRLSFLEDDKEKKKRHGLPGKEVELVPVDLADSLGQLKLDDTSATSEASTSMVPGVKEQKQEHSATVNAFTDQVQVSLASLLCESDSEEGNEDDDEEQDPLQNHIDCEKSALGNWEPSRSKGPKPVEKQLRRPIVIDPLPLPPSTKKRDT